MNPIHKITGNSPFRLANMSRKTRIVGAGALALALCAFGAVATAPIAQDDADVPVKSVAENLALPNLSDQIAALQQDEQQFIHEERVRSGDSVGTMLARLGVEDAQAQNFIRSDKLARRILSLKNGKRLQAETDENGLLLSLRATLTDKNNAPTTLTIARDGDSFKASEAPAKLERRVEMRSRELNSSSLYSATDANVDGGSIPDSVVGEIVKMFSTNIDFRGDIKRGDRFNVVYETFWLDGELVKTGRILAGEFINRGVSYQAVWFEDPVTRQGGYYSLDGKSLKKAFLKSPLEFSRVSSGFANRVHPISGQWKAHKGIDYAASLGTPIHASGDGTIDFIGVSNGYGNMVVIKHWGNYSTAYAHMSRFNSGLRKGAKVSQGEVIGFVGSTGWSTGAHLHYEFRVANVARDPSTLKDLMAAPLSKGELARFRMAAAEMNHRFSLLTPGGNAMAAR
ncbi:peptidoglycan DD-metalloendopeptidase family protein [Massilia sp. Dwa41.01b]|uniref:M23 family metallopeptidase n=1 Tax=unclassified Massilia TaxID=2609279 RepID=UPI00160434C1|nr:MULTISPECIES: peptidoglycan DD-metalloendopeptidase family protein [unclassified Massilia]QNA87875.1 peptidoglycan DD-metalloendopeptidase family protein [Massilia sp. Dwa41.01b]QNA98781.1 peptidoglycan DD-metalloendopeptidase family protein [Massilia sp. Se16.2.3]